MELDALMERLPFILLLVGFVLFRFFLRRRNPEIRRKELIRSLLSEVRLNYALAEVIYQQKRQRRFEVVSWSRNKDNLEFLDRSVQASLTDAFRIIDDYNQQLNMAKKLKSAGFVASVNIDRLKEALDHSWQGLEEWLLVKVGSKQTSTKLPSVIDRLFGGGD